MNVMAQVAQRMTADEYLAAPHDGRRTMLVEGEVVLNEPVNLHQFVLMDLIVALNAWVSEAEDRGRVSLPLDVRIDDHNVFGPDVMWYAEGRVPRRRDPRPYPLPDVAVEVRSPSTWRYDIGAKKAAYERMGFRELWLVDTVGSEVLVFRRSSPGAPTFDLSLELGVDDELGSRINAVAGLSARAVVTVRRLRTAPLREATSRAAHSGAWPDVAPWAGDRGALSCEVRRAVHRSCAAITG